MIVCGFSMGRMGPAFSRSKIGYPLAFFAPEGLVGNEITASETLNRTLYWTIPGIVGCYALFKGAPIYNVTKPVLLFSGWSIVTISWYIMINYSEPFTHDITSTLVTIIGLLFVFVVHIIAVRFVESRPLSDETVEPLSESEKTYVTTVLSRNLGNREGQ